MDKTKIKILFLCTGNSCRSQMAEALARHLKGGSIEAFSAGTTPKGLDPRALQALSEIGVDTTGLRSKHVDEFAGTDFDWVITLCGHANENCPFFPGKTKVIHHGFEDPPLLSQNAQTVDEAMPHYRRVRDEIKNYIDTMPESLTANAPDKFIFH